jgi:hypothetical protein
MLVCKASVEERDVDGKRSQALYAFPPEVRRMGFVSRHKSDLWQVAGTEGLPKSLQEKLESERNIVISIWRLSSSCEKQKYTVSRIRF